MRATTVFILAALLPFVSPAALRADSITLNLVYVFNPPVNGTAPYVSALFTSSTPGTVNLQLTSPGLTTSPPESLMEFDFNIDPNLESQFSPTNKLTITAGTPSDLKSYTYGSDAIKADGDGKYDISLTFTQGAVKNGTINNFTITGSGVLSSINAHSFNYVGSPGSGGNTGPFWAVAHVQNTGTGGNNSGWVAATPLPGVRESCIALLVLVGLRGRLRLLRII